MINKFMDSVLFVSGSIWIELKKEVWMEVFVDALGLLSSDL